MPSFVPEDHVLNFKFWIDELTQNPFKSRLLSLKNVWSSVFLAVLAILVTYAGAQAWKLLRIVISYWTPAATGDGFRDYLGTAIRNPPGIISAVRDSIRFAGSPRRLTAIALVVFTPILYSCVILGFAASLPFFLSTSTAVLNDTDCGYWVHKTHELNGHAGLEKKLDQYSQLAQFISNGTASTTAYARLCYGEQRDSSSCDIMIDRRIPWRATRNSTCPFNGNCINSTAFTMDTGNITVRQFGINSKSKLSLRRQSTCSPIKMDPYQVKVTALNPSGGYAHLQYNGTNATQVVRKDAASPYLVNSWYPQKDMKVHPSLQTDVGNVSIIYISRNQLIHLHRTEDPIFSATEEILLPDGDTTMTGYVPNWERRLAAIACVEKLQLCDDFGKGRECSDWTGVVKGEDGKTGLESFYNRSSEHEKGIISLLFPSKVISMTIGHVASGSGSNLIATQSLLRTPTPGGSIVEIQTAQGEAQWEAEVSQCMFKLQSDNPRYFHSRKLKKISSGFNLILATMQLAVLYFPIGPPFQNKTALANEMLKESHFICRSVKINTFGHTSIRWVGAIMIILWGLAVTILSHLKDIQNLLSTLRHWERERRQDPTGGDPVDTGTEMHTLPPTPEQHNPEELNEDVEAGNHADPPGVPAGSPIPPVAGGWVVLPQPNQPTPALPVDPTSRNIQGSGVVLPQPNRPTPALPIDPTSRNTQGPGRDQDSDRSVAASGVDHKGHSRLRRGGNYNTFWV